MKSKNKLTAVLLSDETKPSYWTVRISFSRNNWAELRFSQKAPALEEFNRIKAAGIYTGQWVEKVEIDECLS